MTDNTSQNPYEIVGARFSPEEYELIQMGLTAVATSAKEHGRQDVVGKCVDLLKRLQQYVAAGQGVPEVVATDFKVKFQKAMEEQDMKKLVRLIRNWMETIVRLEPDPARPLAAFLTDMVMMSAHGYVEKTAEVLDQVKTKLVGLYKEYEADEEFPDGDEILRYLETWMAHGLTNMKAGREPWAGDTHLGG